MSVFSRLFGGGDEGSSNDPTRDWPAPVSGPPPTVSLERRALETFGGRLKFGDRLDSARVLGRPNTCDAGENTATLVYDAWGLTLEFELGKFVQATFAIGASHRDRPGAAPAMAETRGPDGQALTARTTKSELLKRFGEPEKTQAFDDETVLYYRHGPLVSEFQLEEDGHLSGWDVYVD